MAGQTTRPEMASINRPTHLVNLSIRMKTSFVTAALVLAPSFCTAAGDTAVGILQQHAIMRNDFKVVARPTYIFTDRELTEPTVFTGLQGFGESFDPVCCFLVKNLHPVSLAKEAAKYAIDSEFGHQIKAVKGYQYIYNAEPIRDRRLWTPLMEVVMENAGDPQDASPFSSPVVAATFTQKSVPTTFSVHGTTLSLAARYDKNSDRLIYVFLRNKKAIELSETTFPH